MEEPSLFDALKMEENLLQQTAGQADDAPRLTRQLQVVKQCLDNGSWWTLADLAKAADCETQSASARIRDLRKPKFGAHEVKKRRISKGLYVYRLTIAGAEQS